MRRSLVVPISTVAAAGVMLVSARVLASWRRVHPGAPAPAAPASPPAAGDDPAEPHGGVLGRVAGSVDIAGMVREAQPVPPEDAAPG